MTLLRRLATASILALLLAAPLASLAAADAGRVVTSPYQGSVPQGAWDGTIQCDADPGVVCFDVEAWETLATVQVVDATGLPAVYHVATRAVGESDWTVWSSPFCPGSVHPVREGELAIGVATWVGWGCDGLPAAYTGTAGDVVVRFT